jgi:hypothetical protein
MRNKIIIGCSFLLASSAALAQQSLLNAAQTLQGAQSASQAVTVPAPSLTDQLENAAEQKLLQAAPAPIQQGVQTYQQAQQLNNAVGALTGNSGGSALGALGGAAVGSGTSLNNPLGAAALGAGAGSSLNPAGAAPAAPGSMTDVIKGEVKQQATQKALDLLK